MGLSNNLHEVSSDSIPILLVVAAVGWVAHLRSLLLCLLHSLGLLHQLPTSTSTSTSSADPDVGSRLAGLIALVDHLNSNPAFAYSGFDDEEEEVGSPDAAARRRVDPDCVVCLCGLQYGERVRRLPCFHVFHSECLEGWFDQMNLSCPLCRSPLVPEERRADVEQRIGAELVAWLPTPPY